MNSLKHSALLQWITTNARDLRLEVTELNWSKPILPDLHDIVAKVEVEGRIFYGRGHASNPNTASLKAIVESLERAICLEHVDSTNGVAAHLFEKNARDNAKKERLERDHFLSHFFLQHPFIPRSDLISFIPATVIADIIENGHRIDFFTSSESNQGKCIVCLISGTNGSPKFGGILGLCFFDPSESSVRQPTEKAMLEAYRQYWNLRETGSLTETHDLESFQKIHAPSFQDHLRLALNTQYFEQIAYLFPKYLIESPMAKVSVVYSEHAYKWKRLISKKEILKDCPLFIVCCEILGSQNLFRGVGSKNKINNIGLARFTKGLEFNRDMLNLLPHPLG